MSFLARILQVCLLEREQLSIVLFQVPGIVINDVGPLQDLPAFNDMNGAILKELQFTHRILLNFMQSLYFLADAFDLLDADVP